MRRGMEMHTHRSACYENTKHEFKKLFFWSKINLSFHELKVSAYVLVPTILILVNNNSTNLPRTGNRFFLYYSFSLPMATKIHLQNLLKLLPSSSSSSC